MIGDKIDKGVNSYYEQQSLSPEVLARLEAMTDSAGDTHDNEPLEVSAHASWYSAKRFVITASLIFSLIIGAQLGRLYQKETGDILSQVAQ